MILKLYKYVLQLNYSNTQYSENHLKSEIDNSLNM